MYLPKISIRTDPVIETFPATTYTQNEPVHNGIVFNYYFLFLGAFAVLIGASLWWVHARRRRRTHQLRVSGQNALARDLEGWAGTHRPPHVGSDQYQRSPHAMHADGLDEHGEAPPPYEPKNEVTAGARQVSGAEVAIPLRTHAREERDRIRPPGYSVTTGI